MTNIKDTDLRATGVKEISSSNYEVEYYHNWIYESPLYLVFNGVDAYFLSISEYSIEEKYLIFAPTDKNKDILKKYKKLWDTIREEISKIS